MIGHKTLLLSLTKSLLVPYEACICCCLPHLITDILQAGRDTGKWYIYIDEDIKVITWYVSEKKKILANAFISTNFIKLDVKLDSIRHFKEDLCQQHEAQKKCKTLEECLAGPSCKPTITVADNTYTSIISKPILFNFDKLKVPNPLEIVGKKL